jgi:NhaP-type Na+/H+ or K+/H+ antiporter
MPQRIAAVLGLLAFATCLVVGAFQADNTLETTVWRALVALAGTVAIGLVIGWMAQRMLDEHMVLEEKNLKNSAAKSVTEDR